MRYPTLLVGFVLIFASSSEMELTFELPDNANYCYYEEIKSGVEFVIEYQVIAGGQYDVDVVIDDPRGNEIYKATRKQMDSKTIKAPLTGAYKLCFSNEFSTFSHKIVYMDWQINDESHGSPESSHRTGPMSAVESRLQSISDRMRIVDDYQTHHRLREATGRNTAEEINHRVFYWSIGQTFVIIAVGVGQVFLLRSFFSDRTGPTYRRC